jgi:putative spermidine/putrescine transport system ATP-binding protein
MPAPGQVSLERVVVGYGGRPVLHGISLTVEPGEFVCLLGPSGCGKTTTLRVIAGLARVDSGHVYIDGQLANGLPAHRRGIGMVFQDLALFPHMTVGENVEFGLRLRKVPGDEARSRIATMLKLLHLEGLEARLPRQLSGGQQQRVALARSLVVSPSVLLLDEPFAALDRRLREELRREVRALQRRLGIAVVFVTHDQEEALTMADRVVVMNQGSIEQAGSPDEVYERPATRFVLNFVGFSNFLRVTDVREGKDGVTCRLAGSDVAVSSAALRQESTRSAELAIRPERVRVGKPDAPALPTNRLTGVVEDVTYEGALITYAIALPDEQRVMVREPNLGRALGGPPYRRGDRVAVGWDPADAVLFV